MDHRAHAVPEAQRHCMAPIVFLSVCRNGPHSWASAGHLAPPASAASTSKWVHASVKPPAVGRQLLQGQLLWAGDCWAAVGTHGAPCLPPAHLKACCGLLRFPTHPPTQTTRRPPELSPTPDTCVQCYGHAQTATALTFFGSGTHLNRALRFWANTMAAEEARRFNPEANGFKLNDTYMASVAGCQAASSGCRSGLKCD